MSKPFVAPTVIVNVEIGEAERARRELEDLISFQVKSNFDIAEKCHIIKSRGFFQPFTTFQEYAKTLTGLKPRKIQYLTRMAGVFDTVGIPRSVYEPLGVARCREITSLDPGTTWVNPDTNEATSMDDFIRGFVEKGEEIPMEDLKRHVRTLKGFVGENDIVWENVPFIRAVYDNTWRPAIEKAKALIGSVAKDDEGISQDASDAAAAEVIAVNFLNDPNVVYAQLGETFPEEGQEGGDNGIYSEECEQEVEVNIEP